jgi:AcrR family transcriptional regulator
MTSAPAQEATPRKGRPRDERIDDDITAAALEELSAGGFERFTVEAVASRAGVAKTTVYRRFPTREDLVVGALLRLNDDLPKAPPPGPVRDRLIAVLGAVRSRATSSSPGRLLMQSVGEGLHSPELAEMVHARVLAPRRQLIRDVVQAGIDSGELRSDLDPDALIPVLVGPMFYLGAWKCVATVSAVSVDAIVDTILTGLVKERTPASGS